MAHDHHSHDSRSPCGHDHSPSEAKATSPVTAKRIFKIFGMDCVEEVATLKNTVGPLVGGEGNLSFDILNGRMGVLNDSATDEKIISTVARTGMKAQVVAGTETNTPEGSTGYRKFATILTILSGSLILLGFGLDAWSKGSVAAAFREESKMPLSAIVIYMAAIVAGGWFVVPKAFFALRRFRPDMNLLMLVAVFGAAGIGEWLEAASVTFLFSLSLALEAWSIGRARRAIAALLSLAPEVAHVRQGDSGEKDIPAKEVSAGSVIVVLGGERIPLDGKVIRGDSEVNQAPITGESVPVRKAAGSEVFAGTINGEGTLEVETTRTADNTTLANIARLVGEAQSRRAPSEQWVDKFSRVYTPVIMLLAIAVFVLPIAMGYPAATWFYRALVLLVIACPCALVISTPVSIVASLAAAAHAGVLVKGGVYLETPGLLRAIAMDKTGTITEGKPEVVEIIPLSGHSQEELLIRAGALESRSTHPLAAAILAYADRLNVKIPAADDVRIVPGKGVVGHFEQKLYWLGSVRYLQERGQETADVKAMVEKIAGTGRTLIVIGDDTHVCGLIAVADALRPQAAAVVKELKAVGIEHIVMLTGDNKATAENIAMKVGISEIHAELLPEDKVTVIDDLMKRYGSVAMIGDGVNDAPAMGRASLGIAMGAVGSDVAIESADIALMADDLSRLPWLIKHSRRTLFIIKQNIALSLLTKTVFITLNFMGLATLWLAIAADMGTTLVVIANALRLLSSAKSAPEAKGN